MAATADHISRLRRMVAEPVSSTVYTDPVLTGYIQDYPVIDDDGLFPSDEAWTPSYDLNAAAADIWEEKAAAVQTYYNFSADGGRYDQDKLYETAMDKSRYHAARRKPSSKQSHKVPKETSTSDGLIWDEAYAWWRL